MTDRFIYFIGFIFSLTIGILTLVETHQDYNTAKSGNLIMADVIEVPNFCTSKHNWIKIKYNGLKQSVLISHNSCINGYYIVGQKVPAYWSAYYKRLTLPNKHLLILYCLNILFFIIPIYALVKLLQKEKA